MNSVQFLLKRENNLKTSFIARFLTKMNSVQIVSVFYWLSNQKAVLHES